MPPVRLQSADALHAIIEPISPSFGPSRLALTTGYVVQVLPMAANQWHTTRRTMQVTL